MLYPTISELVHRKSQFAAITAYEKVSDATQEEKRAALLEKAREYNSNLPKLLAEQVQHNIENSTEYRNMLKMSDTDVMGVIDIDKINVHLPIYYGTSEAVLQVGVGHLADTSLPIGGESTHAVISAHTGLPSTKLFTDIDQLVPGDIFRISVLGETLVYQVDKVSTVLPNKVDEISIVDGEDYVTLVTCTPYGVNSHRLLVRGKRISNEEAKVKGYLIEQEAVFLDKTLLIPFVIVILLVLYIMWLAVKTCKKSKRQNRFGKESGTDEEQIH